VIEAGPASVDLLAALAAVQRQFIADAEPRQAFDAALKLLLELSGSELGVIGEVLQDAQGSSYLKSFAISTASWEEATRRFDDDFAHEGLEFQNLKFLLGEVLQTAAMVVTNDLAADPRFGDAPQGHHQLDSFLGLPLFGVENTLVGLAGLANRPGGYDDEVAAALHPCCDALGVMIGAAQRVRRLREAEEALRASEARYRIFVDHATDGLFLHRRDGRVVDVNQRACESLGYTRDELIGMHPTDFDPDVTTDVCESKIAQLAAGESIAFDSRHRRKDGSLFPVEVRLRPVWLDGQLHGLALACDITQRKRAEETLRETQQRLALILQGADVGLWDWDLATNDVVFSDEWKSQLGYAPAEIAGCYQDWESRVHPDDLPPTLVKVRSAIERCSDDYNAEFRMQHKDGSWRWILALGFVIAGADGIASRMLGVHIDITRRKQAEEALRASEARYRTFVDHATDGLFLHDSRGRIVDVNQQACDSLGYAREELIGMDPSQFDPDCAGEVAAWIESQLERRQTVAFDSRHRRKDGSIFPVEVRVRPFWIDGERFALSLARDITERKRIEAERERLHREVVASREQLKILSRRVIEAQETERRNLALELHDEIGQILTTVRLSLEGLRPWIAREHVVRLDEGVGVVDQAIDQVREMSLDLRPASLDVLGLETALRAYTERQAARAGLSVDFRSSLNGERLSPTLETVCFRLVQEALTNVLRHARARHCSVSLSRDLDSVRVSVGDDGAGFDVTDVWDRALRGEGFGLLGMRERVLLFGGQIEVDSAPGRGTMIMARFPLSTTPATGYGGTA